MNPDALRDELTKVAEDCTFDNLWEEELLEKVAQFSLIVKGLEELEHPLLTKLSSQQFQEKLAFRGRLAAKALRKLKSAKQAEGGFGSFILDMVAAPLRKRSPKLESAISGAQSALHRADEAAGKTIVKGLKKARLPGASLFKKREIYHAPGRNVTGLSGVQTGKYVAEETAALTEPLSKAQGIVTPALATIGAISLSDQLTRRKRMVNKQQQLMKEAAAAIDQLNERNSELESENIELRTKLAHFERRQIAVEIASDMAERGMIDDDEIVKTAENLAKDEDKDLQSIKTSLAAVQGLCELGRVRDTGDGDAGNGEIDPLTELLLGHIG